MVQRADIIAVRQDITLGDLMKLFESAALSRLVVYRDTLDDPEGIVHIRDLLAYITSRSQVDPDANTRASGRFPPTSTCAASTCRCRWSMPASSASCCMFRRPCPRSISWRRCRRRACISRWWWTNMAAPTASFRSRIWSSRSSAGSTTNTTTTRHRRSSSRRTIRSSPMRARRSTTWRSAGRRGFVTGEAGDEVDTLGGYLVAQVGRLPARGEIISGPGTFEIEVLDADPRRVKLLRIASRKELPAARGCAASRQRRSHRLGEGQRQANSPPDDGAVR